MKRKPLTFEEFREANRSRNPIAFPQCANWEGKDWALAMIGEAGEVCDAIKKLGRDRDPGGRVLHARLHRTNIAKEIADVVTYCDLLAEYYDIDLGEALREKFNEVSIRRRVLHRL